jgi:hypothetical protein
MAVKLVPALPDPDVGTNVGPADLVGPTGVAVGLLPLPPVVLGYVGLVPLPLPPDPPPVGTMMKVVPAPVPLPVGLMVNVGMVVGGAVEVLHSSVVI